MNASAPSSARYRELGPLAEGGMALLSAALDDGGAPVVIKRIRPEFCFDTAYLRLFDDEGTLASCLDHPNIVRLLDRGQDDAGPYLVFERVEGTDLGIVLEATFNPGPGKDKQGLAVAAVLGIFIPLMRGLHAAHEAQAADGAGLDLIHRDISPGNVLLSDDGDVKLADFGVAKSVLKTDETVAGEMKGKFAYMAPEQTRGGSLDRRADLFSAGICLYECLSGRHLFDGPTDADVVHAVREAVVPALEHADPEVPEALFDLLARMLAKDPSARPATAAEIADELYDIASACCLDGGLKRHVARLAQAHPRPNLLAQSDAEHSGPRRRTQKVMQPALQGVRKSRARSRSGFWPRAFIALAAIMTVAGVWLTVAARRAAVPLPVVVERLPDVASLPRALEPNSQASGVQANATLPAAVARELPTLTVGRKPVSRSSSPRSPGAGRSTAAARDNKVEGFGRLFLNSKPWANVVIDGAELDGHTPIMGLRLAAGPHEITLTNPVYKLQKRVRVVVPKNGEVRRQVDLAKR